MQELYRLKIPISTLYPATQLLYRQLGYEQAGSYLKLTDITLMPSYSPDLCLNC
ncbi:MAG: hypothetical protein QNJ70_21715 [Xenococcaceae cyanobacterium MO_207.B15]|nr:hypothetical protein [Xenococcaceae cyanobacterium MO_207.B15]